MDEWTKKAIEEEIAILAPLLERSEGYPLWHQRIVARLDWLKRRLKEFTKS